jgi:hypothetical protein
VKVLIPNLPFYHFQNIAGCLQSIASTADVETILWNPNEKPIIDVFDERSPSLMFLHESQLGSAFNIVCEEFDFDYVLISSQQHPHVDKKPCCVITSKQFEENFKGQQNIMSLLPAAKVTEIHSAKKKSAMKSEVLIVTGIIPHTEPIVDSMRSVCKSYRTKIIGESPAPLPNYLGKVNMFERADFIMSAKVLVDFGSYDYLDAAYLKTSPLFGQPPLPSLEGVKTFHDIPTLLSQIDAQLSGGQDSKKYVEDIHQNVTNNHTYYHRCAKIFKRIGMSEVSDALLIFLKELLK